MSFMSVLIDAQLIIIQWIIYIDISWLQFTNYLIPLQAPWPGQNSSLSAWKWTRSKIERENCKKNCQQFMPYGTFTKLDAAILDNTWSPSGTVKSQAEPMP